MAVAERVKGFKVQFWTEGFETLVREYQDPEGWYITDAGTNEDEPGYYLGFQVRGPGGAPREVAISLTEDFIEQVQQLIDDRKVKDFVDTFTRSTTGTLGAVYPETTTWDWTFTTPQPENACCSDGCTCQSADL